MISVNYGGQKPLMCITGERELVVTCLYVGAVVK